MFCQSLIAAGGGCPKSPDSFHMCFCCNDYMHVTTEGESETFTAPCAMLRRAYTVLLWTYWSLLSRLCLLWFSVQCNDPYRVGRSEYIDFRLSLVVTGRCNVANQFYFIKILDMLTFQVLYCVILYTNIKWHTVYVQYVIDMYIQLPVYQVQRPIQRCVSVI